MREHFRGCDEYKDLADRMGARFGKQYDAIKLSKRCAYIGLRGMRNPTVRKPGEKPVNALPVGTVKELQGVEWIKFRDRTGDYINGKISSYNPDNWVRRSFYEYENAYGVKPEKNDVVLFWDEDTRNYSKANMVLVPRSVVCRLSGMRWHKLHGDARRAAIQYAILIDELQKRLGG